MSLVGLGFQFYNRSSSEILRKMSEALYNAFNSIIDLHIASQKGFSSLNDVILSIL